MRRMLTIGLLAVSAAVGAADLVSTAALRQGKASQTASLYIPQQLRSSAQFQDLLLPEQTFFRRDTKAVGSRTVFAWYLTCCSAFGGTEAAGMSERPNKNWPLSPEPALAGVANFKQAILMAQAAGYDGFALDEFAAGGSLSANEKANISAIFEAAKQLGTGFKLYFVFDQHEPSSEDYTYLLRTYGQHSNYYRRDGKPVASAYAAEHIQKTAADSADWWTQRVLVPLAAADPPIDVFWVPTSMFRFSGGCAGQAAGWQRAGRPLQGISAWQIQTAPIGDGLACLQSYASSASEGGIAWVGTFSWHYWYKATNAIPNWLTATCVTSQPSPQAPEKDEGPCDGGAYYEHAGGKGLSLSWNSLMTREDPAWVVMLTANDYQESYGETIDDYQKYRVSPGNGIARFTPPGWYKPQSGMAALNRYYIQWYKTGRRPSIGRDAIFYNYRTVPWSYIVPTRNVFTGSVNDGKGGTGNILTVSSIQVGFVVPGESIAGKNIPLGTEIVRQLSGVPFKAGAYEVSSTSFVPNQTIESRYYPARPNARFNREPPDAINLTLAITQPDTSLSISAGGAPYLAAIVNGKAKTLPAVLPPGLHEVTIAPFRPGTQTFTLARRGQTIASITGERIVEETPFYNFRPVSGFVQTEGSGSLGIRINTRSARSDRATTHMR